MRAIAIEQFGGPETLTPMDLPTPEPRPGEVRIRIAASGINPVDWKIREGYLAKALPHRFPLIPGWECAGTIDALGAGVSRFQRGDVVYVYTRKPEVQGGTYAEFVVVPESIVAAKPKSLLLHEAASVPLAGLTAYQALFRRAPGVGPGRTVLVHAASGGVGMFGVQLAKHAGATVIGTAGPDNQDFIRSLGVDHPIDYRAGDVRAAVRAIAPEGVDVVFDCVGGETLSLSYELVKPGGRLVSVVDTPNADEARARGIEAYYHFVEPNAEELAKLGELLDAGKIRTHVSSILPFAEAALAQEKSREGRTRGKAVLVL
ncbi:NADP-dependent oxidoreductase [Polyangium jinanense]|uniref:NADP-dependent oxidoreductase n=1 Tax=Polyangium jinanense TaxID=2829994 RepID=A0A9X3XES3_9BACT|nr:NADP-dependent oxidoreductase [Polyangium jinanense]MDC3955757.1 NADP-dependent oxidoreductase [Polyangium jinanense]MDC3986686.1 NADP-dependent oxidoreductase [Polyangium jinanense]